MVAKEEAAVARVGARAEVAKEWAEAEAAPGAAAATKAAARSTRLMYEE